MNSKKSFYFVYLIENELARSWYIGFTENLNQRIKDHNCKNGSKYTRKLLGKWKLIYCEIYRDKKDALGREKFLKSGSGRKFLKKQLANYIDRH